MSTGKVVYVVRRRATGEEIVRVSDFKVGDVLVLLLHLCRNFSVEVDCPEGCRRETGRSLGYLWVPATERKKLEAGMREDPTITWRFVCYDLFNGVECAFYRDGKLGMVDLRRVSSEYFSDEGVMV